MTPLHRTCQLLGWISLEKKTQRQIMTLDFTDEMAITIGSGNEFCFMIQMMMASMIIQLEQ